MKQTLWRRIAVGVLAFAFPIAALADLSQTVTLQANTSLDLETGDTSVAAAKASPTGGTPDLLWNGSTITPQGGARAANFGVFGSSSFDGLQKAVLQPFSVLASTAPIPASALVVDDIFFVFTAAASSAKLLVTAKSGTSITLKFTTFTAPAPPVGPTITAIQNNSSRIRAGFPNYGIAPSSLFVVVGTGLADPGAPVLQSSEPPGIPLTLNGASITVVVNGVTTRPALYYTSPTQLAAVLPAATPIGTGTLTVTYNGATSAPASIQVVPSAVGINTYNTNTGVATDATTGALLTYTDSGSPGQVIVLWTTGLGANPLDSDTTITSAPHPVNTPLQIYFGGVLARILYQGSSGYPGVNQINMVIPDSVPKGCWVPLVAVTGNVISNTVTLPINQGGGPCVDALTGLSGGQLAPQGGQTLKTGLVAIGQTNAPGPARSAAGTRTITSYADAAFIKYTGIYTPGNSVSPGGCIVNDLTPVPVGTLTGMDPGTITLTGPAGLSVTMASQFGIKGAFFATLASGAIPQSGGTFTFKGSGGADVGSFTSTVTFSNPLLTWTNPTVAATIDRTRGFQVTWTGGNPGTYVFILGTSIVQIPGRTDASAVLIGGYTCMAPVEAGQFTVPSYILLGIPAGTGGVQLQNNIYLPLSATGLDIGLTLGGVSHTEAATYTNGSTLSK